MEDKITIDSSYVEMVKLELTIKNELLVPTVGKIIIPTIKDIESLSTYLYLISKYCDFYDEPNAFIELHDNPETSFELIKLITMFTDYGEVIYIEKFNMYACGTKMKIDANNFNIFLGTIKIAHHKMEKNEYVFSSNEKSRMMMLEAKKRKKALQRRQEEQERKNRSKKSYDPQGLRLHKLVAAVCARHPSINNLNVKELTYYQLIDNFHMVNNIDKFDMDIRSAIAGASKDGKITHYTE